MMNAKLIREQRNLTQIEMAIKCQLSFSTIQKFEADPSQPKNPSTRRKLADGYGVAIEEILGGAAKSDESIPADLNLSTSQ